MVLPDGAAISGPARRDPRRGEIPMMRAKRLETWQRQKSSNIDDLMSFSDEIYQISNDKKK